MPLESPTCRISRLAAAVWLIACAWLAGLVAVRAGGALACDSITGEAYSDPPETAELDLDPERWHVGSRLRDLTRARKEYLPASETLNRWSELVSWEVTFRAAPRPLAETRDGYLAALRSRCPSMEAHDLDVREDRLTFVWSHTGCYGRPPQHEVVHLVIGAIGTHRLSYSVRGRPLGEAERDAWQKRLEQTPLETTIDTTAPGPVDRARLLLWRGEDAEAAAVLTPRAEAGDARAQVELAGLYYQGYGVERDRRRAFGWFERAAEADDPVALFHVGRMYEEGSAGEAPDPVRARPAYRRAAELGEPEAQERLAELAREAEPPDFEGARRWYERAAAQGQIDAAYWLGWLAEEGRGQPQRLDAAARWYRRAARAGSAEAQFRLGRLYALGQAVEQSDPEAVKWLSRAASQGNADAREFYRAHYGSRHPRSGSADERSGSGDERSGSEDPQTGSRDARRSSATRSPAIPLAAPASQGARHAGARSR